MIRIITTFFMYFGRTLRIGILSLVFGLAFPLAHLRGAGPRLLHWYFQAGGGGFLKFGQILAVRYDFLPVAYCEELSKLLDHVPPAPAARIIRIIEADLKLPVSEAFASFDPDPIGSASIAQVHRAQLPDGTQVAVKVMRPESLLRFRIDFVNARMLGHIVDFLGLLGSLRVNPLIDELIQLTREELDFAAEARNTQIFHEMLQTDRINHYAPQVYFDHCGRYTITMAYFEGVSVQDLIQAVEQQDEERLNTWAQQGITPRGTASLLMRATLTQMFEHRLFQADPHPANLIMMPGGKLGYIDFGMVGWLDEQMWAQQFRLRQNVAEEKIHAAYETVLQMLEPVPIRSLALFEMQVKAALRDWILASRSTSASLLEKSSGTFFLRLFNIVRKAGLRMPSGVARLFRTILVADIVMLKICPDFDWTPDLNQFIRDETARQLREMLREQTTTTAVSSTLLQFSRAPRQVIELLDRASERAPVVSSSGTARPDSLANQAVLVLFRYLRLCALAILALVLLGRFVLPETSEWAVWTAGLGPWWAVSGAALLFILMTSQIISRYRG